MALREADCCHNCTHFLCEKWDCFGYCKLHPEYDLWFHTVCDEFEKRTGDMAFKEPNEKD